MGNISIFPTKMEKQLEKIYLQNLLKFEGPFRLAKGYKRQKSIGSSAQNLGNSIMVLISTELQLNLVAPYFLPDPILKIYSSIFQLCQSLIQSNFTSLSTIFLSIILFFRVDIVTIKDNSQIRSLEIARISSITGKLLLSEIVTILIVSLVVAFNASMLSVLKRSLDLKSL